jgi:glutathione S-transferase
MSLYGPSDFYKTQRVLISSKYSGKDVELKDIDVAENLCVPKNSLPVYVDEKVTLFETNAIALYLGNDELKGIFDNITHT